MTASAPATRPGGVPVLRPVGVRQVSAGLATGAAVTAVLSLGVGLTSTWDPTGETGYPDVVTRVAGGESVPGWDDGTWSWVSLDWTLPGMLAVLLLTAAAVAALLGARDDEPGAWSSVAQLTALAGAGLLAGIAGVQAVVGRGDIAQAEGQDLSAQWGPATGLVVAGVLLALAAAATARRGRARVLAVVDLPAREQWAGAPR
ncbi:hypothetical protein JKP75_15900 [Blastococcus sp. TML/M2B]|uniref:hypothetical protein n=1 Tax=unclassified Blastococcus TaxID=2619396 RepID=UPI00190BC442|nr:MULTISPECIES: hypothetical protein [unclassified Blastococcus]MBN1093906.1 hypothetical protein [Blastococcus sp. TML/M2B]MBN1095976.1 hypothetical protein [Blastococcus sp. TML/C7B]